MQATIKQSKTIKPILDEIKEYLPFNKTGVIKLYPKDYSKVHNAILRANDITDKKKIKSTFGNPIEIEQPFKVTIEMYRG